MAESSGLMDASKVVQAIASQMNILDSATATMSNYVSEMSIGKFKL